MTNYSDRLDEILDSVWNEACDMMEDGGTFDVSRTEAKQAITQLIADEVKKAIDDYQTNFEQRHIASAVQLARIDELKHLVEDGGIWYQDMTRQFPQKITLNQRIKELE